MDAFLGVALLSTTALLYVWGYRGFRRPQPSGWTQSELLATSITLAITFMFGFGLAFIGKFLLTFAPAFD